MKSYQQNNSKKTVGLGVVVALVLLAISSLPVMLPIRLWVDANIGRPFQTIRGSLVELGEGFFTNGVESSLADLRTDNLELRNKLSLAQQKLRDQEDLKLLDVPVARPQNFSIARVISYQGGPSAGFYISVNMSTSLDIGDYVGSSEYIIGRVAQTYNNLGYVEVINAGSGMNVQIDDGSVVRMNSNERGGLKLLSLDVNEVPEPGTPIRLADIDNPELSLLKIGQVAPTSLDDRQTQVDVPVNNPALEVRFSLLKVYPMQLDI